MRVVDETFPYREVRPSVGTDVMVMVILGYNGVPTDPTGETVLGAIATALVDERGVVGVCKFPEHSDAA